MVRDGARRGWRRHLLLWTVVALAGLGLLLALIYSDRLRPRRAAVAPPAEEGAGVVSVGQARLAAAADEEAGASPESSVILTRGTAVRILRNQSSWLEVEGPRGARGWLRADQVEGVQARAQRLKRRARLAEVAGIPARLRRDASVRLGPGRIYPVWGVLQKGIAVTALSIEHGWFALRLAENEVGFVPAEVLDLTEEALRGKLRAASPSPSAGLDAAVGPGALPAAAGSPTAEPEEGAPRVVVEQERPGGRPQVDRVYESLPAGATPPRLLERVDPLYSPAARRMGVEGTVIVRVTIDEGGRVRHARILRGLPLGLGESALRAVRRWRFQPAQLGGHPIAVEQTLTFHFQLDSR